MEGSPKHILIGGEAGQGLQTIGLILLKALVRKGYHVYGSQTYESRVRGGHNTFSIRVGTQRVLAPQEEIDLLIALNEESIEIHREELTPNAFIIGHADWNQKGKNWIGVPVKELGKEIYWNTASIGVAASLLGLDLGGFSKAIRDILGEEKSTENIQILEASYHWFKNQSLQIDPLLSIPSLSFRLVMNGHEAVALGAISSGLKFCSFYPMSPSTSIAQTLIDWANEMDLVVIQAEDEIAAINMAIGASYAGAPSIVPTSGGGFALMVEAVSLSAISETPVVVVIGQRPGPATGLATRTEQGELWFVLHAGHGEFPRAIFSPGTIEECFYHTRKALELAEKYQGPIFLLTDHFLADSYSDIKPIQVESLSFIKSGSNPKEIKSPYLRYRITESGISPRLLPGLSKHLVVADSHEHTEDGHMTENLTVRPKMMDKRLRKAKGICSEVIPPTYIGKEDPDILFVCWGSSMGSVQEATFKLSSEGKRAAMIHFSQIWPMVPENFFHYLNNAKKVICVESNATGQLAQLIRRETGFLIQHKILRYDGLPITPQYILRNFS
ncbi:MAG: 2-oxoacid:acceptor oxidoreductase subunit alpha [Thermodesulfobacteriota bacterium]